MFLDIHHHLIYGVDDGPRTFEETQAMLRQAYDQQVRQIVCTSHGTPGHHPFPSEQYVAHLEQTRAWCREVGLPMALYSGCEILYTDESPRLLKAGYFPTLGETWNVLVEFTPDADFKRLCDAARALGNAGFTVLFAHVERYSALRKIQHVETLRNEYGVLMQMNTSTVLMKKGFFTDRWVWKMLDEGLVDCVASDAHNVTSRCCTMKACYDALRARYDRETAMQLCGGFQRKLLGLAPEGQDV